MFPFLLHRLQRRVEQRGVAAGLDLLRDALVRIDVGDLADADHLPARRDELVEHRVRVRRRRQVAAVARAYIRVRTVPDERTRNNAADLVLIDEFPRDVTKRIQPVEAERLFVRGDLEHAVGRGVEDRLARAHVLVAEFGDDRRARRVAVTEIAGQIRALHERIEQFRREGVLPVGKVAPVEHYRHTGDLPVPARRVLAARELLGKTVCPHDIDIGFGASRELARAVPARMIEPEPGQVGKRQRRAGRGALARYVAERIRPGVTKSIGIIGSADSEGVEHEDDGSTHRSLKPPAKQRTALQARHSSG